MESFHRSQSSSVDLSDEVCIHVAVGICQGGGGGGGEGDILADLLS